MTSVNGYRLCDYRIRCRGRACGLIGDKAYCPIHYEELKP